MNIRKIFSLGFYGLLVISAMLIPTRAQAQIDSDDDDFELIKNLEIFHTLMRDIRIMYVEETSSGELIKTAMDKMLETLDPYTVYYPESLVEDVRFMNTGEYAGIGANVVKMKNGYVVETVFKDSPADKAMLKVGDKILKINDKTTADKNMDELDLLMKGEPGTSVKLDIESAGAGKTVTLKRAMIDVPNIPYSGEIAPKIGYINLSGFTQNCGKEFRDAFVKLKNDKKIEKLIIDLRYNPGGLLVEAVNIVNLFVNKGEVVVDMRGRVSEWNKVFKAENAPLDTEIPIVVLVNGNSASAAEIVSGALQDLDRAVIIGEKTYGKGLVQSTRDLVFNSKMKVTTAKYYIPSGRCIQKLDYGHKDSTGKATRINETANKTFKTKNGRPVKDAGGIMPDIIVNSDTMAYVVENLVDGNIIFDYATRYQASHANIKEPEQFTISDSEISDLKEFAGSNLYNYKTPADKELKLLEMAIKDEYKSETVLNTIKTLKSQIEDLKKKEFEENREQIRHAMGTEIVRRYYYDEGVIRYSLKHDQFITKGIEVLNDAVSYKKILSQK
ncbi:MAG: S41 family peptidase [Bacteroidales bacterium]|nr:S41 family peptidase [Bacteroidales bacterium]